MMFKISTSRDLSVFDVTGNPIWEVRINDERPVFKLLPGVRGVEGPPGKGGEPEGESVIELIAGQNLSSGRAVIKNNGKIYYFNPNDLTHIGRAVGITKTSGLADQTVQIIYSGIITDASFSFAVDKPLYIGVNGQLFQSVQDVIIVQKLALSIETNKILIDFFSPIIKTNNA